MASKTKRARLLIALVAVLLLALPMTVGAASPHFIKASASIDGSGALVASFKEAGLGDNVNIDYLLTADSTVVYYCVNGGNKNPSAANKQTLQGPVAGTGTFSSAKNGTVSATLKAGPLGPGGFSCPNGQRLTLGEVHYTNIQLKDMTNNVTAGIAGELHLIIVQF